MNQEEGNENFRFSTSFSQLLEVDSCPLIHEYLHPYQRTMSWGFFQESFKTIFFAQNNNFLFLFNYREFMILKAS